MEDKRLDLLADDISEIRRELGFLTRSLQGIAERLLVLEHSQKTSRWLWAGAGGFFMLGVREVIPLIVKFLQGGG